METRNWMSYDLKKSQFFLFPTFVSIYRFLGKFQFSFPYFARRQLFPMFSLDLLRGKLADGYQLIDLLAVFQTPIGTYIIFWPLSYKLSACNRFWLHFHTIDDFI